MERGGLKEKNPMSITLTQKCKVKKEGAQ